MAESGRTITVLYFAAASTALGITSEQVPLPQDGLKLSKLTDLLVSRHPNIDLEPILSMSQWSVDCEMEDDLDAVILKGGEEIDRHGKRRTRESFLWVGGGAFTVLAYLLYSTIQSTTIGDIMNKPPKAAFYASRLTNSTFLIKEYNDIYSEHPHIYAKMVPTVNAILLIDTGCGGVSTDSEITIKSLRQFVEVVKIDDNGGKPLNEGGKMGYVVALTHCHYDHILGVEDFQDWPILASSHSPSFLAKGAIPEHSLCKPMGIRTPQYTPTLVPHGHDITSPKSKLDLGVTILHTPGHTPDEIALFDEAEMMLYVGDSLYEYEPIIFPSQGSIVMWFSSMEYLLAFIKEKNALSSAARMSGQPHQVLINSGHVTTLRPALEVLVATIDFMKDVVGGREKVKERGWSRGEVTVTYEQEGSRFSLRCPERLVLEARHPKKAY